MLRRRLEKLEQRVEAADREGVLHTMEQLLKAIDSDEEIIISEELAAALLSIED